MSEDNSLFANIKSDLPASIIVFLVAMPLCLGIAMASGAPLFSGLIAGIIGGIVVGSLSGSALGVSGPAAGLALIVLASIQSLGGYEIFLLAVVIAGLLQIGMGYLRAGVIAYYFPSSVINGMLAGIGLIIFLKQIPHAVGYDANPEGNFAFTQPDHQNTFSELLHMLEFISLGPLTIAAVSLFILILWETSYMKKYKVFNLIQGPLVAVALGIVLNVVFRSVEGFALIETQIVRIPVATGFSNFLSFFRFPDFSHLLNPNVYVVAVTLALVGSIETLLCTEASDKQDPQKRMTPPNRELKAQGVGNIVSGLIGGLPITQVIVRSSVNVQAGGKTKLSAILHGFIILLAIVCIPNVVNLIPLATLAAILLVVGFKLAKPALFIRKYKQGPGQFFPFLGTVTAIVLTDLLTGIGIGLVIATLFVLYQNFKMPIGIEEEDGTQNKFTIKLSEDLSFLKKARLLNILTNIPESSEVLIDGSKTHFIHYDVSEIIMDFVKSAETRGIKLKIIGMDNLTCAALKLPMEA